MRKGRWFSAGVSEINLRNPTLNHVTRRDFYSPLHLTTWPEWDVNHDGESVDHPSVSAQSGGRTLQRENQAHAGNGHHDEDVGRNQSV
jgi:hypothetical protein